MCVYIWRILYVARHRFCFALVDWPFLVVRKCYNNFRFFFSNWITSKYIYIQFFFTIFRFIRQFELFLFYIFNKPIILNGNFKSLFHLNSSERKAIFACLFVCLFLHIFFFFLFQLFDDSNGRQTNANQTSDFISNWHLYKKKKKKWCLCMNKHRQHTWKSTWETLQWIDELDQAFKR